MKRVDLIYTELKNRYCGKGLTTAFIAEQLNLSRANVSNDLNQLVTQGKAKKETGKPVLYHPIIKISKLEKFSRTNPSLNMIISQAQAAVLYPPKGLNMLFYGETGVGKSMFASIIYDYAKDVKKISGKFPFVHFNCADYANNPQLLLGQLFGVSKSSYTGATDDRKGLIEEADGGMLFLDEIHRLPPEGQEMLFTFIDRGIFHRLGESDLERNASVQLLAATTESPNSALLQTFQRRIPMVLKIPNLEERSPEERGHLITLFFQEEANRLQETIKLSQNSYRAFLHYHCPNNIGQLKNDIQLTCAKAYADFLVAGKCRIMIHSPELPPNVLQGLYYQSDHRENLANLNQYSAKYLVFSPDNLLEEEVLTENQETIYDVISSRSTENEKQQLDYETLIKIMQNNFASIYPKPSLESAASKEDLTKLKNVLSAPLLDTCVQVIQLIENLLGRVLNPKIQHALAIHIFTTYNRIRRGDIPQQHPDYKQIKTEHPDYIKIAEDCILLLNATLDIEFPEEEAAFLAMFFIYNEDSSAEQKKNVRVIVITHGNSTATSMTTLVNSLLGVEHAWGINMNIDESPAIIIERLKQLLIESHAIEDILFCVDMGSLNNIGSEISKALGNECRTISLVSTAHVLEATRKAIMGHTLEEIYCDTLQVNLYSQPPQDYFSTYTPEKKKKSVLLTFCLTGEGTAKVMKNILKQKLNFSEDSVQIIPVTLLQDESINDYIRHLQIQYHILCVITSIPVEVALPHYQLYDLFQTDAIAQIQEIIDIDTTYREISTTLEKELIHVSSHQLVDDVKNFIQTVEDVLGVHFNIKIVFGAIFHISCLIDHLKGNEPTNKFPDKEVFIKNHQLFYKKVCKLLFAIEKKYGVQVPDDEICYILSLFLPQMSK